MSKTVLGLDMSKGTIEAELMLSGAGGKELRREFENTRKGHRSLQGWLTSKGAGHVHACLEATGRYGEAVAEFLHGEGHTVSVVNPLRVKRYAECDLKRNKTDRADAHTIADFCRVKVPRAWHPMPAQMKHLRELTRRLGSLGRMIASERNRLELASTGLRRSLNRVIRALEKEVEHVRRTIERQIDDHPDLRRQMELLESVPGIGRKTAQLLLGELQFRRYPSARSVAAEAGVSPRKEQSGTTLDRTRLSKVGNGRVRKALYLPAVVATRHNPIVRAFAQRLAQRNKAPMQVVCAAMNKLLHIAYGVIKNDRPFDPNFLVST